MPPLLGSADGAVDSVGDGDGGVMMSVGVGTGGSVSGGSGERDSAGRRPLVFVAVGSVVPGTTTPATAGADDGETRGRWA